LHTHTLSPFVVYNAKRKDRTKLLKTERTKRRHKVNPLKKRKEDKEREKKNSLFHTKENVNSKKEKILFEC